MIDKILSIKVNGKIIYTKSSSEIKSVYGAAYECCSKCNLKV